MKKINLILIILVLLFTSNSQAQKKVGDIRLGMGLNGGIPMNTTFQYSLGPDIRLQYDMSLKTSLLATTGYTHLFNNDTGDLGFVPAKLGFKSYFGDQLYVLGEVGAAIGLHQNMGTSFLWAPGVGVATKHIDISLRYESLQKFGTGQVALRLAYGYKL
jgi:hypothetical protein